MGNKLRPKYEVITKKGLTAECVYQSTDPNDVNSPFVLMPRKDPAAFAAMVAYARMCEPSLASEIKAWLRTIAEAPVVFGTQGERNVRAMRLKNTIDIMD